MIEGVFRVGSRRPEVRPRERRHGGSVGVSGPSVTSGRPSARRVPKSAEGVSQNHGKDGYERPSICSVLVGTTRLTGRSETPSVDTGSLLITVSVGR